MTGLRRWLIDENLGRCPDWYPAFIAADLLHCPPWDVLEHSVWYQDKAHVKAAAERQAREQLALMKQKGY